MEHLPHSDPPKSAELAACRQWVSQFLQKEVQPGLDTALTKELATNRRHAHLRLVGAGGTAAILARIEGEVERYDRARIEAVRLSRARIQWHVENLWKSPLQERKQIIGLPASRADVILTGAVIYEAVMDQFAFSELRVSTRGLRFAAVLDQVHSHKRH